MTRRDIALLALAAWLATVVAVCLTVLAIHGLVDVAVVATTLGVLAAAVPACVGRVSGANGERQGATF